MSEETIPPAILKHLAHVDQNLTAFRSIIIELSKEPKLFTKLLRDILSMADPRIPTVTPVMAITANCTIDNILKVVFEEWSSINPTTRSILHILFVMDESEESIERTKERLRSILFPPSSDS